VGDKKRNFIREIITFNIVGIINTGVTYLLYSCLVFTGINYKLALVLDYCAGIALGFTLHRNFTFRHTGKITVQMIVSTIVSYVIVFFVNLFILSLLVEKFNFNKYVAQFIALCASVALSYTAQKFIIFRKKAVND
jgi:putative flippase GtrA